MSNVSQSENENIDECPVCFTPLDESVIVVLLCKHKFCINCILRLNDNKKCPLCRWNFEKHINYPSIKFKLRVYEEMDR